MPSQTIQWFPGHMAKTRRLITECMPLVDLVIEVLDARIPQSSKNPELARLLGTKPRLTVLSKSGLADPAASEKWREYYKITGAKAIFYDCRGGENMNAIAPAVRALMGEKLERYEEKGMTGRRLKAMIVGIPNVGKSSLINKLSGQSKAKVEDRPGVTVNKQWIPTTIGIDLLDMPGVLWPKFEDMSVGEKLAFTGAVKDDVVDIETLACRLLCVLNSLYKNELTTRYKIETVEDEDGYELLKKVGKARGMLVSGGEINTERAAITVLDEFRGGKLGRITLELPKGE